MHIVHMFIHPHGWWILGDVGIIVVVSVTAGLIFGSGVGDAVADFLSSLID